jgi:CO/xanthine dehydrogenase Mo-binding subunit
VSIVPDSSVAAAGETELGSSDGRASWRHDGLAKVTGSARYTADLQMPGMLHAELLYAGRSRARITRLDTAAARALPGVVAVITQDDLPDVRYGTLIKDRTLMARGEVRFEGEVVAAVTATTAAIARQACQLIEVDYEDLEPMVDAEVALTRSAALVHEDWETMECLPGMVRNANSCAYTSLEKGDVEAALATADHVVSERFESDMAHPVPIEPRAVLASWEGEKVTIWSSTQVPHVARAGVAETLEVPERSVRVVVPHLGGGFGGKCVMHYEPHVAALARVARRPVRLLFDRAQEFLAPDMRHHPIALEVTTGLRSDGTIVARKARMTLDTGPYSGHGPMIAEIATFLAVGPYRIPNLDVGAHAVYTNHGPSGSVRAPSGPQVCWAIEQHTDSCAQATGLDPTARACAYACSNCRCSGNADHPAHARRYPQSGGRAGCGTTEMVAVVPDMDGASMLSPATCRMAQCGTSAMTTRSRVAPAGLSEP